MPLLTLVQTMYCLTGIVLTTVLQGEFRESMPQSLEFQVQFNQDPATNIPALRVKCFEDYNLKHAKSLVQGSRKVILVQNARFTDYHNILYYIYTGQLNLRFQQMMFKDARPITGMQDPTMTTMTTQSMTRNSITTQTMINQQVTNTTTTSYGWEMTVGFPRPANPNEIYRLAGMMGLGELQTRAYHFLMSTCSVDNIFDRLFDPYCKSTTHAPVRSLYQGFLAKNWDQIRQSGQWATLLRRYRATQREEEAEYLLEVLCEILNAVTWDPKITNIFTPKAH